MNHAHSTAIDPSPIDTRIRRLENALADFTAAYSADHSITRTVAANLANAHAARDAAQGDRDTGETPTEAAR